MTFYRYKDNKITQLLINPSSIGNELAKLDVTLLSTEFNDLDETIQKIKELYDYDGHDSFQIWNELVKLNKHHHVEPESRLFLTGSGKYTFIQEDDIHFTVSVSPGDFIIIPPNLKHYFNTLEQTSFIRFFPRNKINDTELTG